MAKYLLYIVLLILLEVNKSKILKIYFISNGNKNIFNHFLEKELTNMFKNFII